MSGYYPTIDSDKGLMAQLLDELDRSHSHSLSETQRAIVDRALAQYKRERAEVQRWSAAQDFKADRDRWIAERAEAIMAEYPKADGTQCRMKVSNQRGFGIHNCRIAATRWADGNLCGPHAKAQATQQAKDDRWRFEREQREAQ